MYIFINSKISMKFYHINIFLLFNYLISIIRFWRNNGIAFTWLEGEPVRSNPTLLSNIIQYGPGFIHYTYLGDITNGPFFTWILEEKKDNHM